MYILFLWIFRIAVLCFQHKYAKAYFRGDATQSPLLYLSLIIPIMEIILMYSPRTKTGIKTKSGTNAGFYFIMPVFRAMQTAVNTCVFMRLKPRDTKGLLPLAPTRTTLKTILFYPGSFLTRIKFIANRLFKLLLALATPTLRQWVKVSLHENLLLFKI